MASGITNIKIINKFIFYLYLVLFYSVCLVVNKAKTRLDPLTKGISHLNDFLKFIKSQIKILFKIEYLSSEFELYNHMKGL